MTPTPPAAASPLPDPLCSLERRRHPDPGSRTIIAASRDLSGAAVPKGTFTDSAALLRAVGLPQYEKLFEEEEMDPDTLIEVLEQQGKASLEEALKELEIKSMGHRLKIINALVVQ